MEEPVADPDRMRKNLDTTLELSPRQNPEWPA